MNLSGGFYLLSQEGDTDPKAWKIKWKKEVKDTDNKDVEASNLATQFPKKKDNSQVDINGKDYWDFVETDGSLTTGSADPKPVH